MGDIYVKRMHRIWSNISRLWMENVPAPTAQGTA